MSLTWLETEGGPFIVVPRTALSHWSGREGDYDRACKVVDLPGRINVALSRRSTRGRGCRAIR
ncbi:Imm21 family immunity protein [Streptomyces sp. NPDC087538]|uniref:Imm21 family immunity protein n=1 Tax=Streptomyces sp. NPDC087538 TaxID=3365797 RepID=UPI00380DE4C2